MRVIEGTKLYCNSCWEPARWGTNCDSIFCPRCGRKAPTPAVEVAWVERDPFEKGSGDPVFLREVPDWVATELPEEIQRARAEEAARWYAEELAAEEAAKQKAREVLGVRDLLGWFRSLPREKQQEALWQMDPHDGGFGDIGNFRDPELEVARWVLAHVERVGGPHT